MRYAFSSWSDGLDETHTITTPPSDASYTATFKAQYAFTTSANPTGGGTVTPTGENWYDTGKKVTVSAKANPGYGFSGWSGDLSGKVNPVTITMNGPKNAAANFVEKVTLLAPNGAEAIPSGVLYPVSWRAPSPAVKFKLMLLMDSGLTWSKVAEDLTEKTYDWRVPVTNKKGCLLKVIGHDSSGAKVGADASDRPFMIQTVKLTSPNGGETFHPEGPVPIAWTIYETVKPVTKVLLYYTTDAGSTWKLIDTLTGNYPSGGYIKNWTVPTGGKVAKTKCKVKVVLKNAKGATIGSDVSDNYFTIAP
jgi:hypothetical protein